MSTKNDTSWQIFKDVSSGDILRISPKQRICDIISDILNITTSWWLQKPLISWSNRVSSQVLILLPERLISKHRIYDYQQFAHASGDRNLVTFTCSSQPLIEPLNGRITSGRCQRCHVQTRANRGTASPYSAAPFVFSAIAI